MPLFAYKALDAAGKSQFGSLPAANRASALDLLAQKGLIPVAVDEGPAVAAAHKPARESVGRVSQAAAESFIRELSNLLAGGVALSRALHILSRESSNVAAKKQWIAIHDDVVGGVPLADALARWPKTFSNVQVAMVRAGEAGGFLSVVLGQIADFRGRERDLKSKVKGALIYPCVLAVLSIAVVIFLLTFFIPRFAPIFEQFGGALPALTRGIISVSHAITHYGPITLIVVVVLALVAHRWLQSDSGKRALAMAMLRIPAVGAVVSRFALVRFCRMLGTLLGAGVPLVSALKVAREAIGNQILSDAVTVSIDDVQRGESLARSLASCPQLFPGSITEVIAVAEETARLDQELLCLATANETELDHRLRVLVTLAEPALLFMMAAFVGTIVIGMLLPVFTLQDYIH
jgi:type II secretory pathway component PulF